MVPEVGDGNPEALSTFLEKLRIAFPHASVEKTVLRPSAWLPKKFHEVMSGSVEGIIDYSQKSDGVRSGHAAKFAKKSMWVEIRLHALKDRLGKKQGDDRKILVAVQEMALQSIPTEHLDGYGAVYLLIPDVLGKLPTEIADEDKPFWAKITVVVWNEYAQQFLTNCGYKTMLVEPWMSYDIPELVANPVYPEIKRGSDVYIKTSGSGWPREWQKNLVSVFSDHNVDFSLYLPNSTITDSNGERNGVFPRPFYEKLSWHPPKVLIGYPSELIQVLAAHSLQNDTPSFYSLPPKGLHELTNLIWAMQNGFCQGMIFPGGYANALPKHRNSSKDSLSLFHRPEISIFHPEFLTSLKPPYTYENLLLSMQNHIPLEIAVRNGSFSSPPGLSNGSPLKERQHVGLGTKSFADQLSR